MTTTAQPAFLLARQQKAIEHDDWNQEREGKLDKSKPASALWMPFHQHELHGVHDEVQLQLLHRLRLRRHTRLRHLPKAERRAT